jgi:hypothetical protein
MSVRLLTAILGVLVFLPVPASAQPPVAVGAAVSVMKTRDAAFGERRITLGPMFRLVPRQGLAPSWGLSWFETEFDLAAIGGPPVEGRLNIRPVMAGASYTFGDRDLALSLSAVGGYAFNRLRGSDQVSIENSPVFRPGVSLWKSLHPRFGLNFFGGYVVTRPTATINGVERKLKADYAVFSAGGAVVLF